MTKAIYEEAAFQISDLIPHTYKLYKIKIDISRKKRYLSDIPTFQRM